MNKSKIFGVLFLVVGLIVLVMFAAADILQIGENPYTFGPIQIGGSIVGVVLIVIGLILLLRKGGHIDRGNQEA
jgi:hypothetical protein